MTGGNTLVKTKEEYTALLDQLRDGEIETLTIDPSEFFVFQQAFMDYKTRKRIVGKAGNKGIVVYHYAQNS